MTMCLRLQAYVEQGLRKTMSKKKAVNAAEPSEGEASGEEEKKAKPARKPKSAAAKEVRSKSKTPVKVVKPKTPAKTAQPQAVEEAKEETERLHLSSSSQSD